MSFFDSLYRALGEAIEYEKGNNSLRSNRLEISDLEDYSAEDIKSIRCNTGLSQNAFAAAMGVSKKAVEAWESGANKPSGTTKRLLGLIDDDPQFFEKNGIITRKDVHDVAFVDSVKKVVLLSDYWSTRFNKQNDVYCLGTTNNGVKGENNGTIG